MRSAVWLVVIVAGAVGLFAFALQSQKEAAKAPPVAAAAAGDGLGPARKLYAAKIDGSRVAGVRGRNHVMKVEAMGPDNVVLGFVIEKCDDEVALDLLRAIGKAKLRDMGFVRLLCMDPAEKHASLDLK